MATTWRKQLEEIVEITEDPILSCTLSEDDLDRELGDMYKDPPFWAWGLRYVYFSVEHRGDACVGYAPIDPQKPRAPENTGGIMYVDEEALYRPVFWG